MRGLIRLSRGLIQGSIDLIEKLRSLGTSISHLPAGVCPHFAAFGARQGCWSPSLAPEAPCSALGLWAFPLLGCRAGVLQMVLRVPAPWPRPTKGCISFSRSWYQEA